MRDMVPGSRLCLAFPKLEKADIDDLKTVQIVEAMEDVDSFAGVPGKALRCAEVVGCSEGVWEGNNAAVDVYGVP